MTRRAELSAQYATVEEILEQPSPLAERLGQLCEHLVRHVAHYTMVAIYLLLSERPGSLTLAAAAGRRPYPATVPLGAGPWSEVADRGETVRAQHLAGSTDRTGRGTGRGWVGAQLVAPVVSGGLLIGVVAVDSRHPAPFRDDDELFVENLADLVAVRLALAGVAGRGRRRR